MALVALLTRATSRRIAAVAGLAIRGNRRERRLVAHGDEPCVRLPCGFVFLITWRIARRFGWRGLAVSVCVAAVLGPVRDYSYMAAFPEWGSYARGLAPVFAISAAYVLLGILGHATMRLVAGPAGKDP